MSINSIGGTSNHAASKCNDIQCKEHGVSNKETMKKKEKLEKELESLDENKQMMPAKRREEMKKLQDKIKVIDGQMPKCEDAVNDVKNDKEALTMKSDKLQGSEEEITKVKVNCDKEHWHTQACPHTSSTMPAPKVGQPGHNLDEFV